jgi:putative phage-type endonuclease
LGLKDALYQMLAIGVGSMSKGRHIMHVNCEQNSADWFAARCGRIGSSRIADCMSYLTRKSKNGVAGEESAARKNLKGVIVAETLTRIHQDSYVSDAMKHGVAQEPFARALYELKFDVSVDQVGVFIHPRINRACASPDGCIRQDGLIEIKAPNTTTHLGYLIGDVVPEDYKPQMLWQMACCEREWADFVSFDPRLPQHLQLFVKRFWREDARIAEMEAEATKFLTEVDDMIARLPKDTEAERVAKAVEEDMALITGEDIKPYLPVDGEKSELGRM